MSGRRVPAGSDHEAFCLIEGWSLVQNAGGRRRQHRTFELALPDGRVLRTRISRTADPTPYGPSLWGHLLRDQLDVTGEEFWACVVDCVVPQRGRRTEQTATLPAKLALALQRELCLPDERIAELSHAEAIRLLNDHWARSPASDAG